MQGVISASLLVVLSVATVVGALVGLLLGGVVQSGVLLAIIAALVANLVAAFVRYKLVFEGSGAGADESKIPTIVVVNAAIASLAGGLAGHNCAVQFQEGASAVWIGALSGLIASILMALLMITYHYSPHRH